MIRTIVFIGFCSVLANGIWMGHDTDISQHPWQVAIFHLSTLRCGGTLISPDWVITSARCLCYPGNRNLVPNRELYIVVGATNINEGITYGVSATITNDQWDQEQTNDIGLIRTTVSVEEEFASPVELPGPAYYLEIGTEVLVTGWGKKKFHDEDFPEILQEITVHVTKQDICTVSYKNTNESWIINDDMFCGGVDESEGDLGGPAVVDGVLVGIISQGADGFFGALRPGLYTLVAHYRAWITVNTLIPILNMDTEQ